MNRKVRPSIEVKKKVEIQAQKTRMEENFFYLVRNVT